MNSVLPPLVMDIMMSAVLLAKSHQVRKVENLERLLRTEYPGKDAEIKVALKQIGKQFSEQPDDDGPGAPAYY